MLHALHCIKTNLCLKHIPMFAQIIEIKHMRILNITLLPLILYEIAVAKKIIFKTKLQRYNTVAVFDSFLVINCLNKC